MNAAGSGAKRKTKRAAKGKVQGALEVPGLLLLALGFLLLGLLLPLPTGELGALARGALVGTVGFGAYLLPWPPLVLGGLFLLWADAFARVVMQPRELPIGVLTAAIGAPFLLILVRRLHARKR